MHGSLRLVNLYLDLYEYLDSISHTIQMSNIYFARVIAAKRTTNCNSITFVVEQNAFYASIFNHIYQCVDFA